MRKLILLITAILLMSGCCYQTFTLDDTKQNTIPTYEGTNHFVFWGIGQEKKLDPNEVCKERGINSVQTSYSFISGFFNAITYGIYSPRDYAIYCN
ncbi:MAG: Bor family protein [Alphaproteobacteria bacterium]